MRFLDCRPNALPFDALELHMHEDYDRIMATILEGFEASGPLCVLYETAIEVALDDGIIEDQMDEAKDESFKEGIDWGIEQLDCAMSKVERDFPDMPDDVALSIMEMLLGLKEELTAKLT